MKKILTICPSRERPERLNDMLESFFKTSTESDLIIIVDEDDLELDRYREITRRYLGVELLVSKLANNTERFNKVFKDNPDYDYYHMTNDDFIYRTDGWDKKFIKGLEENCGGEGIVFGNDQFLSARLCTCPFISGVFPRTLGWLQLPCVKYLFADNAWQVIGTLLHRLIYAEGVIIEHMHFLADKAEIDETYRKVYNEKSQQNDKDAFVFWAKGGALEDIDKLKAVLNETKDTSV